MSKVLLFDIESSHLKADFGTMLCVGYKWLGEDKVYVPSIASFKGWKKDVLDDSRVAAEIHKAMTEADMWVSYFGKGFDLKFLQAKFLEHGLPVVPSTPHVDLFFTVKANLALSRKSLANVAYFLKLEAEKTPVEGRIWKRAAVGDADALAYVVSHCEADVKLLEEAYLKLRPLVRTHPRIADWNPCRVCGSTKLQRRGSAMTTLRGRRIRVMCTKCGAWESRSEQHAEIAV